MLPKPWWEEKGQTDPSAETYYLLGELNKGVKKTDQKLKAFGKALEKHIHFDTNASMAEMTYAEVGGSSEGTLMQQRHCETPTAISKIEQNYVKLCHTGGSWKH